MLTAKYKTTFRGFFVFVIHIFVSFPHTLTTLSEWHFGILAESLQGKFGSMNGFTPIGAFNTRNLHETTYGSGES
jgi:hypothetical protein